MTINKYNWFINSHFSDLDRNFFYFLDSLFNSLVVTSDNSTVDNRINNIVKERDYGFSDRTNNCSYKKEWECLFKYQAESVTYSKSPFLLRSAALLNDIMSVVCKRQHILNVSADNTVRQPSRVNADPIYDPSGIG
ncbi:hypothetical protein BCR32DRAFT_297245 [Anaeromyces robustus]|uniref:Uncharacterized protein n=1 Tax=Anaeromyces robustus TaxID=1754192 RepID=A0A1Y1WG66_9FUNG|nr:hypothetical protein BCR32DRAFT_297245 [Anaeromyces robustus]|eukprot:ORX72541.1 hypothetical protein BCR32DRAFT_297245 [Anaeromyces robustus]